LPAIPAWLEAPDFFPEAEALAAAEDLAADEAAPDLAADEAAAAAAEDPAAE